MGGAKGRRMCPPSIEPSWLRIARACYTGNCNEKKLIPTSYPHHPLIVVAGRCFTQRDRRRVQHYRHRSFLLQSAIPSSVPIAQLTSRTYGLRVRERLAQRRIWLRAESGWLCAATLYNGSAMSYSRRRMVASRTNLLPQRSASRSFSMRMTFATTVPERMLVLQEAATGT